MGERRDSMLTVFQVCFFVGIGLTLLSFFIGQFFDFFGMDGIDLDFNVFGWNLFFPISPMLYMLFFTVFGGVGWILYKADNVFSIWVVMLIAVAAGMVIAGFFSICIIGPLKKAQNTSAPEEEELIGVLGKVTEKIYKDGFGEITYMIHGNCYSAPAKTTTGESLEKGSDVTICWIEEHVFYVSNINL